MNYINITRFPRPYGEKCSKKWIGIEWGSVNLIVYFGCAADNYFSYYYVENDTVRIGKAVL